MPAFPITKQFGPSRLAEVEVVLESFQEMYNRVWPEMRHRIGSHDEKKVGLALAIAELFSRNPGFRCGAVALCYARAEFIIFKFFP